MASFFKRAALVGVILVALGTMAAIWFFTGHGIRPEKLAALQRGMTTNQVAAVMGEPSVVHGFIHIYGSHFKCCRAVLFVGTDGRVTDIFHDH